MVLRERDWLKVAASVEVGYVPKCNFQFGATDGRFQHECVWASMPVGYGA